jgi:hypothetical protein
MNAVDTLFEELYKEFRANRAADSAASRKRTHERQQRQRERWQRERNEKK